MAAYRFSNCSSELAEDMNDNLPITERQAEMRERGRRGGLEKARRGRGGYRGKGKQVHLEKRQMQEIARAHGPECIERLRWLMRHGENQTVQLAATNAILDRGFGKPVQPAAVGFGPEAGGVRWVVSWATSDDECGNVLAGLPPRDGEPQRD